MVQNISTIFFLLFPKRDDTHTHTERSKVRGKDINIYEEEEAKRERNNKMKRIKRRTSRNRNRSKRSDREIFSLEKGEKKSVKKENNFMMKEIESILQLQSQVAMERNQYKSSYNKWRELCVGIIRCEEWK